MLAGGRRRLTGGHFFIPIYALIGCWLSRDQRPIRFKMAMTTLSISQPFNVEKVQKSHPILPCPALPLFGLVLRDKKRFLKFTISGSGKLKPTSKILN